MDPERTRRIYSAYSSFYDIVFGRLFQKYRCGAIDLLEINPGEKILEIGVGTGLSLPLYPSYCKVVGIDFSSRMLEKGNEKIKQYQLANVTLHQMDATSLDFETDSFDSVLAAYVMTTLPDPKKTMSEIIRVCKEDGKIVLVNHFSNGNRFLSGIEKNISTICKRIGFRTDLTLETLISGTSVVLNKKEKMDPLALWKIVRCINKKGSNGHHPLCG